MSEIVNAAQNNETVELQRDIIATRAAIHEFENYPWTATNPIFELSAHLSEIEAELHFQNGEDFELMG